MGSERVSLQGGARRRRRLIPVAGIGALLAFCLILGVIIIENREGGDLTIPNPVLPADNGYDGFVRAYGLLQPNRHPTPYDMPTPPAQTNTFANFKACALDAAPALAELHRDLDKPYLYPPQRSLDVGFPSLAHFRELARTVAGAAKYEELRGRPGRAADILLDGAEMGVTLPHGGSLIVELVGVAIEAICEKPLESLLPKLSPSEAARVAARLKRIQEKRVSYADVVMESNYSDTAGMLDALRRHRMGLKDAVDSIIQAGSWHERWIQIRFLLGNKRAMLHENQVYARKIAEEAKGPYTGPSRVPAPANPLAEMIVVGDTLDKGRVKYVSMETVGDLLEIENALYRYHAANGRFPAALADLTPVYLDRVPADPFGGRPLPYHLTATAPGFLLYSLGPHMIDTGGTPTKYPGMSGGNMVAGALWQSRPLPKIAVPASELK